MEGQKMRRPFYLQICCLLALSAVSCSSMGHKTIPRDQFDYNAAVSNSWRGQMLLNTSFLCDGTLSLAESGEEAAGSAVTITTGSQ
jgi:hypothetical protein